MGVSVVLSGGVAWFSTAYYPAVQEHHWVQEFPYPSTLFDAAQPLVAASPREIAPAIAGVGLTSTGTIVEGFARDWYNRIHVTPSKVDVGNLITTQERDIKVWNAFFEPKTLVEILESADAGTTLTQPYATPYIFRPLQEVTYTLGVSPNGPPKMESTYIFNFLFTTLKLSVVGNRIVIWPFSPQEGILETLEWKTDVMRAKAKEQRIALRDAPRQGFSLEYFMTPPQVTLGRAMAAGWAHRQFGVPVWTDIEYVGDVAEGATSVQVNTDIADYRVGETILIWKSDTEFAAAGIDAITGTSVTFNSPLPIALTGAHALPLRYARAGQFKMERVGGDLIRTSVDFNVLYNKDHGASIGLPMFDDIDVLTDLIYKVGSYEETIEKKVTIIDNGFGFVVADALYNNTDQVFMVSWDFTSRADLWRTRRWLHSLKGKQKTFWLPSVTNDLTLVLDATEASQQSIVVQSINYALYYTAHAVRIKRKSGVTTYHKVTGGTTNGSTDTLSFTAQIGTPAMISDIESISFMHRVRLDADRIEINHTNDKQSTIRVPVMEVPE